MSIEEERYRALYEVNCEMAAQVKAWGVQNHKAYVYPDIFDKVENTPHHITTDCAKMVCNVRMSEGGVSWQDILNEEFMEARDEAIVGNPVALREELIQVAAVAMSWVQSLDREFNRCKECGMLNGTHQMGCGVGCDVGIRQNNYEKGEK